MSENPFESPRWPSTPPASERTPSNAAMWRAYVLAPAVAPVVFVLSLAIVLLVAGYMNAELNPASVLVLPAIALSVGMIVSYAVAGMVGMPIAYLLRNLGLLNGYTIHGAALGWVIIVCGATSVLLVGDNLLLAFAFLFCGIGPPVLLSGTAFWLLVRTHPRL